MIARVAIALPIELVVNEDTTFDPAPGSNVTVTAVLSPTTFTYDNPGADVVGIPSQIKTLARFNGQATVVGGRAVVELLAHLAYDGLQPVWPVAVVAESPDDGSVVFRSYFSRWLFDGAHPAQDRPQVAGSGADAGRRHGAA